ncbi:MAG: penicillin-binding protein activator [Thermodesulfobacteriota bacterium]|nr:penicillin-binding protein activator [Thermodesulfobacteriota bacterium]
MIKSFLWKKAVPAIVAGMAFFLVSCKARIPVEKDVREKERAVYVQIAADQYKIAKDLYQRGEYERSMAEALTWIENYPGDSLRKDVLVLLGDNSEAMGDIPHAFYWWLKAMNESLDNEQRQRALNEKLGKLIEKTTVEELQRLAPYAVGSNYAPKAYYRLAFLFLEQDELENAQHAARSLVQSTQDPSWISKGKELLDRIHEEMSVEKGTVGCLLPLSGPFSIYGEEVLNGIELGMDMFADSGQGPSLELVIRDTQAKSEKAVAELEDMVKNEKVMAVIGPLSSRTAVAVAEKAEELGVPIITLTQKKGITEAGDMVFRNFMTPSQEVGRLVDTAINEMGIKRFAILYPDNSYGRFYMNLFWDRLEETGGIVTAAESYGPEETDFARQIKKITGIYYPRPEFLVRKLREMRPPEQDESEIYPEEPEPVIDFEAVFMPDNFQRIVMIAPQLVYHDVLDVQLMGTSLWQSPELIDMAGDYVQDAIFPSGFIEGSGRPGVERFVEQYLANFDSDPGILAATGYDTIRLLKEIMAGEDVCTRRDIHEALLEHKDFPGVTGTISFDSRGEVIKEPILLTVSGRRIVVSPKKCN